jgi:hypothetical protein
MTLLYERFFGLRNGEMPLYLFSLPDDLASPEASEELANDAEARQVAQIVANELSRNRYDGEEIAVLVFNDSGQLIHKVWTRSPRRSVATRQTLFPEHVHPRGFYQMRKRGSSRWQQRCLSAKRLI